MDNKINLILLEFFVDDLIIYKQVKSKIPNYDSGKLCVLFKFLDFPPLQVKEDAFPREGMCVERCFHSGRSGLFSLPDVANIPPDLLLVDVYVVMKFTDKSKPSKVLLGQTKVNLTQDLTCITSEAKIFPEKTPITRSIRNSFVIKNREEFVGSISLFTRASCFGTMIVRKFISLSS